MISILDIFRLLKGILTLFLTGTIKKEPLQAKETRYNKYGTGVKRTSEDLSTTKMTTTRNRN